MHGSCRVEAESFVGEAEYEIMHLSGRLLVARVYGTDGEQHTPHMPRGGTGTASQFPSLASVRFIIHSI